ncbi:hypothetical protein NOMA109596_18895 [Nocardioides marinus]
MILSPASGPFPSTSLIALAVFVSLIAGRSGMLVNVQVTSAPEVDGIVKVPLFPVPEATVVPDAVLQVHVVA